MKENIKKMSSLLQNNQEDKYQLIDINKIILDPSQPRKVFDTESIKELSQSIKQFGVLTPVSVSKQDDGSYILRHGERRYRASKLAGLEQIPAIIDNEYSNNKLIKQLIENIQREALSMDEIAEAISTLYNQEKMSLSDIASALGKSNAYVSNFYQYSILDTSLKDKLVSKTNDILVISEFNRILKKISKIKNNNLKKILENSYYDFINKTPSLNRGSIENLKILLENIENSFNEREELREKAEETSDIDYYGNNNLYTDDNSNYAADNTPAEKKYDNNYNNNYSDTDEYDMEENIPYTDNLLSLNHPRIEIKNNKFYYVDDRNEPELLLVFNTVRINSQIQNDIAALLKEHLKI